MGAGRVGRIAYFEFVRVLRSGEFVAQPLVRPPVSAASMAGLSLASLPPVPSQPNFGNTMPEQPVSHQRRTSSRAGLTRRMTSDVEQGVHRARLRMHVETPENAVCAARYGGSELSVTVTVTITMMCRCVRIVRTSLTSRRTCGCR